MYSEHPKEVEKSRKRIVVLGGGTGTFTVLSGLKRHSVELSAVVSMSDNGGSTGVLRSEYGVLPHGDIRQCLVALSAGDELMRRILIYRFTDGPLAGHNFGNLLLTTLEQVCGDSLRAVSEAHRILNVRGRVIPVSAVASDLWAELADGTVVHGEHAIGEPMSSRTQLPDFRELSASGWKSVLQQTLRFAADRIRVAGVKDGKRPPISRCFLDPAVNANPEAVDAILNADLVVLGPGDLYTSLIPVLLVDGIAEAIAESPAYKIYIVNLVTKRGETDDFTAKRFCTVVDSYLAPASMTGAIMNTAEPSPELLKRYDAAGDRKVHDDLHDVPFRVWRAPLISERVAKPVAGDALHRSLLRHDPLKLAEAILSVLKELSP
jgi:2-phospho-L-lactate transferase/gluconeogenesis factor (CofD/UPF0052 family)